MTDRRRAIYRPPWRIDLTVRRGVTALLPMAVLARTAAHALDAAGARGPASLGLTLADDRELASLNATHMGASGPTDVLSFPLLSPGAFPMHPGKAPAPDGAAVGFVLPPGRRQHLGDIVVSVERATEQASGGRGGQTGDVQWSAQDELRLLVVHGVLHVCGWDHAEPAEEAAMRTLERRILAEGPEATPMTSVAARAELIAFALGYPEATLEHPWGEDVVKVRGKIFVFFGVPSEALGVGVKLPDLASFALAQPFATPTGYGLARAGWVSTQFGEHEAPPMDILRDWIDESYRAVAPKRLAMTVPRWAANR